MPSAQTVYPGPKRPDPKKKKCKCCPPPPCRICSVNVALAAFLIGLVVAGIGAAVAAFQWHEEFVRGICMFMVVGGFLAIVGAAGLFIWDRMQLYKSIRLGDPSLYVCDLRSSLRRSGSFSNPQKLDAASLQPTNNKLQEAPPSYDSLHRAEIGHTEVKQLEYQKNSTADTKSVKSAVSAAPSTTRPGVIALEAPPPKTHKTPATSYDSDSLTTISYSIPKQFLPKNFQQPQVHYSTVEKKNVTAGQPQPTKLAQKPTLNTYSSDGSMNKSGKSVSTDV